MRIVRFCFATLALSVLSSLEGLLSLITRVFGNVSCADDAAPTRTHTLPVPRAPCFNANAMGVLYHAMRQHTAACVLCAATFPFIQQSTRMYSQHTRRLLDVEINELCFVFASGNIGLAYYIAFCSRWRTAFQPI